MLISKCLYTRHPVLTAAQILTVRGILSMAFGFGLVNKDLPNAMWYGVPEG